MKSEEFIKSLPEYCEKYIEVCLNSTKEIATGSGVKTVKERHLPTIDFFLSIWLPRNLGETIVRSTYYEWLRNDDELKSNTIKSIDDKFRALAKDIVANEGKGIFYAKNFLGMTDKIESKNENNNTQVVLIAQQGCEPMANEDTTTNS